MGTKHLIGSPAKDAFNFWHKTRLPKNFYAIDIDLCLLRRDPHDIVAVIDYKAKGKESSSNLGLGYSHVNLYNRLIDFGIPVYIVWALWNGKIGRQVGFSDFDMYEYLGGDPGPDNTPFEYEIIEKGASENDFLVWETKVRDNYVPRTFNGKEWLELLSVQADGIIQCAFDVQRGYLVGADISALVGTLIQTAYVLKGTINSQK